MKNRGWLHEAHSAKSVQSYHDDACCWDIKYTYLSPTTLRVLQEIGIRYLCNKNSQWRTNALVQDHHNKVEVPGSLII